MKTIRKISLLVLLSFGAFASAAAAEPSEARTGEKQFAVFDVFLARATRFLQVARALESESLFASMPRITWGQIKAKYRNPNDPNNPKGS